MTRFNFAPEFAAELRALYEKHVAAGTDRHALSYVLAQIAEYAYYAAPRTPLPPTAWRCTRCDTRVSSGLEHQCFSLAGWARWADVRFTAAYWIMERGERESVWRAVPQ